MKKYVVKNGNGNYYWRHADMQSWDHTTPTILDNYDEALRIVKNYYMLFDILEEKFDKKGKKSEIKIIEWEVEGD
ncbi:hypothetical protein [Leuconostoc pseudomesenteroides]|uniref:hypothetical protein n=1 Tax=Leuconostoc pseudomesenteroides TaxID=33968 RepID=UPI0032DFF399